MHSSTACSTAGTLQNLFSVKTLEVSIYDSYKEANR